MKKYLLLLFIIPTLITGCTSVNTINTNQSIAIKFSELSKEDLLPTDKIKSLDGKEVSMIGFMAAQSPLDGEFIYLVSVPYLACPYCDPDTNMLKNVIPVMAGDLKKIKYTESAIIVKGTLEVSPKTDEFGYSSPYRIIANKIETVDTNALPQNTKNYINLVENGFIEKIDNVIFDVFSNISLYKQMKDTKFLKTVDISKIDALLSEANNYNMDGIEVLKEILNGYKVVSNNYNNEIILKKNYDEKIIDQVFTQNQIAIDFYNMWTNSFSSIEEANNVN